jgi:hypothetical protein
MARLKSKKAKNLYGLTCGRIQKWLKRGWQVGAVQCLLFLGELEGRFSGESEVFVGKDGVMTFNFHFRKSTIQMEIVERVNLVVRLLYKGVPTVHYESWPL